MQPLPTWDEYYLEVAKAVAQRSDIDVESAGVVIVTADCRLIAAGFERTTCHAERDALHCLDLSRATGGIAYCTRQPCDDCHAILARTGLFHIVTPTYVISTSGFWALAQGPRDVVPDVEWTMLRRPGVDWIELDHKSHG